MQNQTLFTKIIDRQAPAFIVAEDKWHIAFLDINPVAAGHTLVVPKKVTDYFFDIPDKELQALICFSKRVAKGIQKAVACLRVGLKVHGLDVPHAHIHLIPIFGQENHRQKTLQATTMKTMASTIASFVMTSNLA